MQVHIDGIDELRAALKRASDNAIPLMGAALYGEAEDIMGKSRKEVPVDTGVLRASGTVEMPRPSASGVEVSFGYGGAASQYAVVQHERMDYSHTVGGPKFLEKPTLEAAYGMGQRLAARLRRMFSR